jgi:hypothetical protein
MTAIAANTIRLEVQNPMDLRAAKAVISSGWARGKMAEFEHMCNQGIAKAEQMSEAVESNAIRAELESMVNECVSDARAKERRPGQRKEAIGTVTPTNSGKRRRRASVFDSSVAGSVEIGDAQARRRRGFQIKWAALGDTVLGQCHAETRTVALNIENHFIKSMRDAQNKPALLAVAVGLLCHVDDMMEGAQKLVICKGEFADAWGTFMSSIKLEEAASGTR